MPSERNEGTFRDLAYNEGFTPKNDLQPILQRQAIHGIHLPLCPGSQESQRYYNAQYLPSLLPPKEHLKPITIEHIVASNLQRAYHEMTGSPSCRHCRCGTQGTRMLRCLIERWNLRFNAIANQEQVPSPRHDAAIANAIECRRLPRIDKRE